MLFDRLENERNSVRCGYRADVFVCVQCAYTFGRVTFNRPMVDKFCHATYSIAHAHVFLRLIFFTYWLFGLVINELSWSITIVSALYLHTPR